MPDKIVDLRSDTVTQPCDGMKAAMMAARLGDDVYEEDPTAIALQETLARMTHKQAALFFPSGTQSNLAALLSHCQRGDEYIVGQNAHTYKYEGGGAAVLGSIQPQPIEHQPDGTIDLAKVEQAIKADDFHFARTRLLALENTIGGRVIPLDYIQEAKQLARSHDLGLHLDGARVFNAAVELDIDVCEITEPFDSISICLSKGLGAPIGSVLCGSRSLIDQARRWRKMVGGGMRQVGLLAAAGLFALEHNVSRLKEDHQLARYLADKLRHIEHLDLVDGQAHTNMLFVNLKDGRQDAFLAYGAENGILFGGRNPLRMVTHKQLDKTDIDHAVNILTGFFT